MALPLRTRPPLWPERESCVSSFELQHILALFAAIVSGYWLRFHAPLPAWLRDASGGALYVVAWALVLKLAVEKKARWCAIWALVVTCAIEFSQLWRPSWLVAFRRTLPGRLLLGSYFNWWDFLPYFAGAWLAYEMLKTLAGARSASPAKPRRVRQASRG
jgi:hypothetical protein